MLEVEISGEVAVLHLDDGKANVVSEAFSAAVNEGLDRAAKDAKAVILTGRPGRFSAGFDLNAVKAGGDAAKNMRDAGARMMARLLVHPQPLVIACTGHALAAGALILCTGDTRIGIEGDFKIGLNETAIGLTLPPHMIALAASRMPRELVTQNIIQAKVHDPVGAVAAGYLDEVVAPGELMDTALARAANLAAIAGEAYGTVKQHVRGDVARILRAATE